MGWAVGYDERWQRDIGYGVPAWCDYPGCGAEINRGLSYVCGGEPYGGDRGCGLYFCGHHLVLYARLPQLCDRCAPRIFAPYAPTPDHPDWIHHKLTDPSWQAWREKYPDRVRQLAEASGGEERGGDESRE